METAVPLEIHRSDLSSLVLFLASMGTTVDEFDFLDAPRREHVQSAVRNLVRLEALDANDLKITSLGVRMAALPLEPYLSRSLLLAEELDCVDELLAIVCVLSNPYSVYIEDVGKVEVKVDERISEGILGDQIGYLQVFTDFVNAWHQSLTSLNTLDFEGDDAESLGEGVRDWCKSRGIDHRSMASSWTAFSQMSAILHAAGVHVQAFQGQGRFSVLKNILKTGFNFWVCHNCFFRNSLLMNNCCASCRGPKLDRDNQPRRFQGDFPPVTTEDSLWRVRQSLVLSLPQQTALLAESRRGRYVSLTNGEDLRISHNCVWKKRGLPYPQYILYDNVTISVKKDLIMNECMEIDQRMLVSAGNGKLFKSVEGKVIVPFESEARLVRMGDLRTLRKVCPALEKAKKIVGVIRIENLPDFFALLIVASDAQSAASAQALLEEAREKSSEAEMDLTVAPWISKRLFAQRRLLFNEFGVSMCFDSKGAEADTKVTFKGAVGDLEKLDEYLGRVVKDWETVFVDVPEGVFKLWLKISKKEREILRLKLSDPVDQKLNDEELFKRFYVSANTESEAQIGRNVLEELLNTMYWRTAIEIPAASVGTLIGRRGAVIQDLCNRYGQVKIDVGKEDGEMKSVTMKGPHLAVRAVLVDIKNLI
eukprot:TRINITY_DN50219_c0_g1_i1.p1 TRINITY_DN50219_c0_g1~~TRINITY_DN50219_c0_g1_i1.p1  ORF type:complete len:707 (+),score=156.46 TRINITY_DN50219_c0_g1_i1:176-2122(+)